jgi:hypothetical protein
MFFKIKKSGFAEQSDENDNDKLKSIESGRLSKTKRRLGSRQRRALQKKKGV